MSQTIEAPVEVGETREEDLRENDPPWIVIVWNDPINLMSYVTYVLRPLLGRLREAVRADPHGRTPGFRGLLRSPAP